MKAAMTCLMILTLVAGAALADQTRTFGWDSGVETDLGTYGNVGLVEIVDTMSNSAPNCLHMVEDPVGDTPQVFIAWVTGLNAGDEVSASFYAYDDTPGGNPSVRIWAHWVDAYPSQYAGSAGGNSTYPAGTGWEMVSHDWTFEVDGDREGIVIECRLYSQAGGVDHYIDDVSVTAPDHATIYLPGDTRPVGNDAAAWGAVKALFH